MLIMEVEGDPLMLSDPLDCKAIELNNVDVSPKWSLEPETEMIFGVSSKHSEDGLGIVSDEKRFRGRKGQKVNVEDADWNCSVKRRVSSRRKQRSKDVRKQLARNEADMQKVSCSSGENFGCNLCGRTFDTTSDLKEHVSNHKKSFTCGKCTTFRNPKSYENNARFERELGETELSDGIGKTAGERQESKKYCEHLKSERKYRCQLCQKTFITVGHLNTHMYCHSDKKWKCDGCGKNFSCERSLTRHRETFPGEHWFPCQHCDMNFFRVGNILKHLEVKHPEASLEATRTGELHFTYVTNINNRDPENENSVTERKLCICTKCLDVFRSSDALQAHKDTVHAFVDQQGSEQNTSQEENNADQVPRFRCEICFKEFVSSEGFEYHRKNQHGAQSKEKKMRNKGELTVVSQEDEKGEVVENFLCRVCSESFPAKEVLQEHVKSHNRSKPTEGKPAAHLCCICPKSFTSSDGLKYHLATHTGEKRYSCSICGKRFIKKTHLFEHVATHSQVKFFKCSRCPRTFSTHSAYRKHVKHFPGPHSFSCVKCGKLFTKESMLEKHVCVDLVNVTMAPEVKALLTENPKETSVRQPEVVEQTETKATVTRGSVRVSSDVSGSTENGPHSCYKCFNVFPSLEELQTHQNEHVGKQHYQCRFCPEMFKRADDFSTHIRDHLGSSPYMCLKCNRKFISPLTLALHAKKYPGEHSFTCKKCQRWFPSEKRLDRHECILQNSDEFMCACRASIKSWKEFVEHAGTKPYACCSCNVRYPTLIALMRHIKKHTGVKPFSCEECGKSFRSKSNYLHHKNIHLEVKELYCEHCSFKSKSKKRMDFHLFRKHDIGSNTSSTLCPVCGINFPYLLQAKKHIETEHPGELILERSSGEKKAVSVVLCTLCGKLLSNKYMLANHMKKVHDPDAPKNVPEYTCDVCHGKFRSQKQLERHAEIHEAPSLSTCEICNKQFHFAKDLRKHMKRHDMNKPFSCFKCGKNFKVSVSLKYHSTICEKGQGGGRISSVGKRKKEVVGSTEIDGNIYVGHIDPTNLKYPSYTISFS
ncbi:hypothetical protein RUM44_006832 [Polyplax serrata]|uniref:C2H2-type domain-containing protein n=1 Tax=Polyplax serrata TaxID=468196 RepID=A0ABR1AJ66_POLSC